MLTLVLTCYLYFDTFMTVSYAFNYPTGHGTKW